MRVRSSLVGLALAAVLSFGLMGCGTEVTDEPDAQPDPAAAVDQPAPEQGVPSEPAALGDSITLQTYDDTSIQVTPLEVQDPATSSNEYITPDAGNRYVGIRVRLRNTGGGVFDDSPSNGSAVIDTGDVEWDASIFDVVEPSLGTVKIAPGDSRVGWITFEVGQSSRLRTFQFTTDSGFGNSGEWSLR